MAGLCIIQKRICTDERQDIETHIQSSNNNSGVFTIFTCILNYVFGQQAEYINFPTKSIVVAATLTRRQNNYVDRNLHSSPRL